MENFNIKTSKYGIATIVICLIFIISLPFVYKNAYEHKTNNLTTNVESAVSEEINSTNETTQEAEETPSETEKNVKQEEIIPEINENISEDSTNSTNITTDVFEKALALREEQKYESAVYEYQQLLKDTDDVQVQSKINQEIALTYASIKRYGTALAYSQKAYNLYPSTEKELLLARLYYKTGNIEKATNHINDILKRDFSVEK